MSSMVASMIDPSAASASRSGHSSPVEKHPGYYICGNQGIQVGLRDTELAFLYQQFENEKILPLLFYEASGTMSLLEFLTTYLKPETNTIGCFERADAASPWVLKGMAWINQLTRMGPNHTRASVGEAFVRATTKPIVFCQLAAEWAFDNLKLDVLHGVTPVKNRAACIFVKRMGFQVSGELEAGTVWEGELCPVLLSSMTKQRWIQVSPWAKGE